MVTLAGTQNYSEFELHARAILGIPISTIPLIRNGASAVILAHSESNSFPEIIGMEKASLELNTDYKIFGKPSTKKYRRMGVALSYGDENVEKLVLKAKKIASMISVN